MKIKKLTLLEWYCNVNQWKGGTIHQVRADAINADPDKLGLNGYDAEQASFKIGAEFGRREKYVSNLFSIEQVEISKQITEYTWIIPAYFVKGLMANDIT